jgi:hypothetical protein
MTIRAAIAERNDENIESVRNDVRSNRQRVSMRYLQKGISVGSIHSIIHKDWNIHCLCQHLVPKMLTPGHEETRTTLAEDVITMPDRDDVLDNISLEMKPGALCTTDSLNVIT